MLPSLLEPGGTMNVAAVVALAALLAGATATTPVEPARPGQDSSITRAVFADQRLWMRSDSGAVFSVAPAETARRNETLPEPSLDICVKDGHIAALTQGKGRWTLRRRTGDEWLAELSFEASSHFVALDCRSGVTVITTQVVLVPRDGSVQRLRLGSPLPRGLTANVHVEGDDLFVGTNRGEFGGGLVRANLRTGAVEPIDRPSGDLCGGTLNAKCDPVNGVAALPGKAGCVVAAVGLVHLLSHGSLVEVCGEEVRTLLSQKLAGTAGDSTVAFFGVTATKDAVVAAGVDGLYRVSDGGVERVPLPAFQDVGGHQGELRRSGRRPRAHGREPAEVVERECSDAGRAALNPRTPVRGMGQDPASGGALSTCAVAS
jgi:hypothetical protein